MKSSIVGLALFLGVSLFATGALANSLDCQKKWSGPSADNSVPECISDPERLNEQLWVAIVLILPIIALIVTLICYPVAFVGRLCCGICGSNKRRPASGCCCGGKEWDKVRDEIKDRAYPPKYVSKIKAGTFILAFLSIGSLVVMTVGATKLHNAYNTGVLEINGIITYLDEILASVKSFATLESGEFIPPLSSTAFESFSNVTKSFDEFVGDFKDQYDPIVSNLHSLLVALAIIPTIFLFLGFGYASFDVRKCLPNITTLFYFVFVIAYTIASLLCFMMALVFLHLCTEIDLHHQRRPGIMQWWVVPTCYENAAFAQFESDIYNAQRENSVSSCTNMQEICSVHRQWSLIRPQKTFWCNITDAERQCTSLETSLPLLNGIDAKNNTPTQICNATSNPNHPMCGLQECANHCIDAQAKSYSSEAALGLSYATRFLNASKVIQPLLDCNSMVDTVLRPLGDCKNIRDGFFLLGAGTGISYVLLMYGIVALFIGQKVFFKLPKSRKELYEVEEKQEERQKKRRHRKTMKGDHPPDREIV